MKFDKTRVYTAVNAEDVKCGSEGYFENSYGELMITVRNDEPLSKIRKIGNVYKERRFENDEGSYAVFYLVKEPSESGYIPYKSTKELVEDYKEHFQLYVNTFNKSSIWLKSKDTLEEVLITGFRESEIQISSKWEDMKSVLEHYTYLDGKNCGKEVDE